MPKVWNQKEDLVMPVGTIYVGRPTKWGNPFVIGKDGNREQVLHKYRGWVQAQIRDGLNIRELKGKDLSCWCAPLPCHADILLELANSDDSEA